ncbi:hypothetical protein O181_081259 [Austropuccinia psidii MF-1]|uniref:Reverse transcriptase RNase H-like domain-containing protein n=1 Tax=Austropuccinia psidii MF-1 TaxID=1389203 RepID=A0A9Q3FM09_9BASI|nr:hypothetical protein [Austropuccinia psidii MF-1]
MLFLLKASRWTKQKCSRFSIGHLQETSRLFNHSLALPTSTSVSSRIIQRRSVHSPVSSRKIPVFPSMRKLSVSFTNSKRLSPLIQSFSTSHCRDQCIQLCLRCCTESGKHPIAFNSRKRIPAELHYEIHDKEILGIVWALKRWRAFLLSLSSPFEILTNHSSLQYFMSLKVLTCHQAHWAEFLSEFHFSITYRPGCQATLPDALLCWDNVYTESGEDFISKNQMNFQQLIKKDEVQPSRCFAVKVEYSSNLIVQFRRLYGKILSTEVSFKNWAKKLNISRDLSTAYHPETDAQEERVNQILGQYIWIYVSYHQDDSNTRLPPAEFAYNNSDHSSTKKSAFFTVYRRDTQFDSLHITQDTPAGKLSTKIQSVQKDVKRELEVAIKRSKRYADKSRASSPVFNPGDMVWLSSKNIK